jgi:hypothetical protein
MDDRFDFLLMGDTLKDGKGLEYVGKWYKPYSTTTWNDTDHSYRVWGNDGGSFNSTLRTTGNTMVGPTIAQAIIDSTGNSNPANVGGHLPVFMDLQLPGDFALDQDSINFGVYAQDTVAKRSLGMLNSVDTSVWNPEYVAKVRVSMTATGDFTAPAGEFTLGAGTRLESLISMVTAVPGDKQGSLTFTDLDTGQTRTISLSGVVMVPEPATILVCALGAGLLMRRRKSA